MMACTLNILQYFCVLTQPVRDASMLNTEPYFHSVVEFVSGVSEDRPLLSPGASLLVMHLLPQLLTTYICRSAFNAFTVLFCFDGLQIDLQPENSSLVWAAKFMHINNCASFVCCASSFMIWYIPTYDPIAFHSFASVWNFKVCIGIFEAIPKSCKHGN